MVDVVIHTNIRDATAAERVRGLKVGNQVETAEWLTAGFARHGIEAEVTADRHAPAEVHVVQGPHYCFDYWRERAAAHRVLFLNRCFWGDHRFDLTLGWLRPDGSRDFRNQDKTTGKGQLPELLPRRAYRGTCVVFGDFGRDMREEVHLARETHQRVYFRPHPADRAEDSPVLALRGDLETVFSFADCAIGHSSTVLVDAELHGLHVTSTDPNHVVNGSAENRELWLARLSWAQWTHEELMAGDFVVHLMH